MDLLARYGVNYPEFGLVHTGVHGKGACAWAIGPGTHAQQRIKGFLPVPNEDALLVANAGDRTLVAVADAHFGHESSHELIERLGRGMSDVPSNLGELFEALAAAADEGSTERYRSESTLAIGVLERSTGQVFGLSFGDSSVVLCGPTRRARWLHPKTDNWVSPCRPWTFAREDARTFQDRAEQGDVLLAFTDGVDECNYQSPTTSIRGPHIEALVRANPDPQELVQALAELALQGVDGKPGGEDNLAIACAVGARESGFGG